MQNKNPVRKEISKQALGNFDAFCVEGRQIKVDTTDFSKIDMEELFSQIEEWKEEILYD